MSPPLDRFRTALKFSLWTWALYWPGGGLLLMWGGLDPISIVVTLGSLAAFIAMMASGALRVSSSRTVKQVLLERPLYLVGALVVLIVAAAAVPTIEGFVLLAFAALWFGGLGLASLRLVEHLRGEGQGVWASRADQLFLVFAMAAFFSMLVFLDALLPLMSEGSQLGTPATLVAVCTWMNLVYPGLVLVASRPFREPLRNPLRRARPDPVVVPVAAAPTDPLAAARRRKAEPKPFRAS